MIRQERAVSFGWSLLLVMSAGLVLLGSALLGASILATERTLERLSATLISGVTATTDARLEAFFDPVASGLSINSDRWRSGEFREWDLARLDAYFQPVIESLPQVSSLLLATEAGADYMLLRTGSGWKSRLSGQASHPGSVLLREWLPGEKAPPGEWSESEYDCRRRPWHVGALAKGDAAHEGLTRDRLHWTDPYKFFTTKEPGVTASVAFDLADGARAVLAFDVLLLDISKYTTKLEIGELGVAFVIRGTPEEPDEIRVLGLPADPRFRDLVSMADFVLKKPSELGGPLSAFSAESFAVAAAAEGAPQRFRSGGDVWWGAVSRSQIDTDPPLWVGAMVPERQLLDGFPNLKRDVIVVTLISVLLAVLASRRVARGYSRPIDGLVRAGERMQRLNFQPSEPVRTRITEIRQLSSTLDEMRTALLSHTSTREDVRIARSVREQMSLPTSLPAIPGLEVESWHAAGEQVGGESLDVQRRGDDVLLLSFDVAGAGVLPVVYGVALRAAFRAAVRAGADLSAIAMELHASVRNDLPAPCRVPTWIGRLSIASGDLEFLSLGHVPALIVSKKTTLELPGGGPIVGDGNDLVVPAPLTATLPVDCVLAIVSDGVLETIDDERHRFGLDGVASVVRTRTTDSLPDVMDRLRAALEKGRDARDDRSALLLRRT